MFEQAILRNTVVSEYLNISSVSSAYNYLAFQTDLKQKLPFFFFVKKKCDRPIHPVNPRVGNAKQAIS